MRDELNLNLEIHSITWQLTRLESTIDKYELLLLANTLDQKDREIAEKVHYKLLKIFYDYFKRLRNKKN